MSGVLLALLDTQRAVRELVDTVGASSNLSENERQHLDAARALIDEATESLIDEGNEYFGTKE